MTISQLVRVPQSCTEQLQHPEINGANPRTASITTLIPFGYANFDLITGRAVTRAASFGLAETSRGRALRGSGAACASIALDLSAYQRITLSFWMYWDAFASDDDLAMEFSPNYNTGGGFLIDPNSGAPAMGFFQVGTGGTSAGSSRYFTRPSAAAWHHYMLVLDKAAASSGGVTAAYVDGSAVSLTTASTGGTTANFPNSTLYLFSRNNTGLFGNGSLLNLVIRGGYTGTADDALAEYTDPWGLFKAPQAPEIWVTVSAGGGSSSLTPSDTTHTHTADSVTLTTSSTLAIADAVHAHTADAVVLNTAAALAVQDATHAHAADGLALTTASALAVQDATHAHLADAVTLSDSSSPQLAVADATHAHLAEAPSLSAQLLLAVADAVHAHSADSLFITASGAELVRPPSLLGVDTRARRQSLAVGQGRRRLGSLLVPR